MSSLVARLDTRSASSQCCNSSRLRCVRGCVIVAAALVLNSKIGFAQLTTGAIDGVVRNADGRRLPNAAILITESGAGMRTVIHSNANGESWLTLPYGRYELLGQSQSGNDGVAILVAPLQTSRIDLTIASDGKLRLSQSRPGTAGLWSDSRRELSYADGSGRDYRLSTERR
jgi:hypothetical protein